MIRYPKIYILLAERGWKFCKNSTSIGWDGGGEICGGMNESPSIGEDAEA